MYFNVNYSFHKVNFKGQSSPFLTDKHNLGNSPR